MIDNIAFFFWVQIENCFCLLYFEHILINAIEWIDYEKFVKSLEIVTSEISLMRSFIYLGDPGSGYTINDTIFKNSIIIDQIIQKISKTPRLYDKHDFSKIEKFFVDNRINDLLSEYDIIKPISQNEDHIFQIQVFYILLASVFFVCFLVVILRKSL
jgi:hypothetical protein